MNFILGSCDALLFVNNIANKKKQVDNISNGIYTKLWSSFARDNDFFYVPTNLINEARNYYILFL